MILDCHVSVGGRGAGGFGEIFDKGWDKVGKCRLKLRASRELSNRTCSGKFHSELRAFARLAGYGDFSAVGFNDGFHEAEAEAEAALGTAFIAAIKPSPDFVLLVHGDADACVTEAGDGLV